MKTLVSSGRGTRSSFRALGAAIAVTVLALTSACAGGGPKGAADTLTMAYVTGGPWSQNLNPLSPLSAWAASASAAWTFNYEPLLQYNFGDTSVVTPWLATDYEWAPDYKSVTFTIRQDVEWSDGQGFSAEDVAYTYELLQKYPELNTTGVEFTSVEMPTADTVTLSFATVNIPALFYVSTVPIVAKHVFEGVEDPITFLNEKPVVTGPYTVASINPQSIQLVANPTYWGTQPAVNKISMPAFFTNNAAAAALTSGEAQWGNAFVANIDQYLNAGNGTHQVQNPPMSDVFLVPNVQNYPLNLQPMREAISLALNRPNFAEAATQGQEPIVETPTGLLPRDEGLIADEYKDLKLTTDLDAAKTLLTDNGFTYSGSDLVAPDGSPVELTFSVNGGFSDWVAGAPSIVEDLKALGINVKMATPNMASFFSDLANGNFDLTLWTSYTSGPGAFYQFEQFLNSSKSAPAGEAASSNYGRWEDPETDQYLADYAAARTDEDRLTALHGIQKVMVEQVPVIPVIYQVAWAQYTTDKFVGWPSTEQEGWACNWCAPTNELALLNLKPVSDG